MLWLDVFRFDDDTTLSKCLSEGWHAIRAARSPNVYGSQRAADEAQVQRSPTRRPPSTSAARYFDGRFNDLELNLNCEFANFRQPLAQFPGGQVEQLYSWAQETYGPDAQPLLPLSAPLPDLTGNSGLLAQGGALITPPADATGGPARPRSSSSPWPIRWLRTLVSSFTRPRFLSVWLGPTEGRSFDPAYYFFFQDNRRCYWVEARSSALAAYLPAGPDALRGTLRLSPLLPPVHAPVLESAL